MAWWLSPHDHIAGVSSTTHFDGLCQRQQISMQWCPTDVKPHPISQSAPIGWLLCVVSGSPQLRNLLTEFGRWIS